MVIWLVVAAVAACVGVSVWLNVRRGRRLRRRFGPEYARVLAQQGDREVTELELKQRLRRRDDLMLRPIPDEARARYLEWLDSIESAFDRDPAEALAEADTLVIHIMRARGYPANGFDEIVGDISVDDPEAAQEYRAGYTLAVPEDPQRAPSREQLRTALMHYRRLVQQLVGATGGFVDADHRAYPQTMGRQISNSHEQALDASEIVGFEVRQGNRRAGEVTGVAFDQDEACLAVADEQGEALIRQDAIRDIDRDKRVVHLRSDGASHTG